MRSSLDGEAPQALTTDVVPPRPSTHPTRVTGVTRRPASAVVLAYLAVVSPLLLNAGAQRPLWVIGLHAAFMAAAAWSAFRAPERSVVADWLPLLLVSFLYGELPYLMLGLRGAPPVYHDPLIRQWELAVFGTQPAQTLAGALPYGWLSELLHFGYLSYYGLIFAPPLALYVMRKREEFAHATAALMVAFTSCFVVFALFPVEGPRYAWPAPPGVPDGIVRRAVLWVLESGSSRGAAFPSSHAAVAVCQATALWLVGARKMSMVVGVLAALLVVGAVYGGFHYAIDMVVGTAIGIAVGFLARARRLEAATS